MILDTEGAYSIRMRGWVSARLVCVQLPGLCVALVALGSYVFMIRDCLFWVPRLVRRLSKLDLRRP